MADFSARVNGGRERAAYLQRQRRARTVRIDYTPSAQAMAIIDAKRGRWYPLNNNSGVINAILSEWAALVGAPGGEAVQRNTPELGDKYAPARVTTDPERSARAQDFGGQYAHARETTDPERSARAQDFGGQSGISTPIAGARARAYESGARTPLPQAPAAAQRVACGARRHRDGKPCQSKSEPGKKRCRFHGGRSTGPRSPEGRARAIANLRQYQDRAQADKPTPLNHSEEMTTCA